MKTQPVFSESENGLRFYIIYTIDGTVSGLA